MSPEHPLNKFLELIEEADACATPMLILILVIVGGRMVNANSKLRHWGLRLAAGGFIAYAIYGGVSKEPTTAEDWVDILIHAFVAGGIILGVGWIALAVSGFLYRHLISNPASRLRQFAYDSTRRSTPHRVVDDNHEIDRRAREAELARTKAEAQRRRTDARASALLSYTIHAQKIGNRFSREMFDRYVTDYMGDQHPPEDVERRGGELLSILEKHVQETEPPRQIQSIDELAHWFQLQKQRIESAPIDDKSKRAHLVELNERYAELTTELLEKIKP